MTQDRNRATAHATFWIINSAAKIQDDLRYHETDDHIFMVLTGYAEGSRQDSPGSHGTSIQGLGRF